LNIWNLVLLSYNAIGLIVLALWEWTRRQNLKEQHVNQVAKSLSTFDVMALSLLALFCVLLWPLSLYLFRVNYLLSKSRTSEQDIELLHSVRPEHLLEAMSLSEIEQQHRIKDQLQAVPDLPFGHLYQSWLQFKTALPEHADIHRFEAEWPTYGKHNQVLKGYAVVVDGTIGEYFVYSCYSNAVPVD